MFSTSFAIDVWQRPFAAFQSYGWMGVDLFFVLSGYLIGTQVFKTWRLEHRFSFVDFYVRRAFRILPAYLVVLALYFYWPLFSESSGIAPLWQFLTFTLNLLIDYRHNKAFSHAWSLCVEEHFYLLFPVLAWWMTRRASALKSVVMAAGVMLAGIALRDWIWVHQLAPVRADDDGRFGLRFIEDIYFPTWARLDGLLAGVVLATIKIYRQPLWEKLQRQPRQIALAGLLVTIAAVALFDDRSGRLATAFGYPLLSLGFALLVLAASGTRGWLATLRLPGARWIAAISYSLYLSHKGVMHLVRKVLAPTAEGHGVVVVVMYVIAVLFAGALLHYAVEQPFLRLRDVFAARRHTDR